MNPPSDHELLLADVLPDDPGFRQSLLAEILRLAGHRRRFRRARRAAGALALLTALAILTSRTFPTRPIAIAPSTGPCPIITTQPLPASAIVTTQPFDLLLATLPSTPVIQTQPDNPGFRLIDDDQLLALAAPKPAALVR